MSESIAQPDIQLVRQNDDEAVHAIEQFRVAIFGDPDRFQRVISKLAAPALGITLNPRELAEPTDVTQDAVAEHIVTTMFTAGHDKWTIFDDDSEDELAADSSHIDLIQKMKNQGSIQSHEGVMKTVTRENPNATPARDKVRWARLHFFAGRVAAWSAANAPAVDDELPSAS